MHFARSSKIDKFGQSLVLPNIGVELAEVMSDVSAPLRADKPTDYKFTCRSSNTTL